MPRASRDPAQDTRARRRDGMLRQRYGLLLVALIVLFAVQGIVSEGAWLEVLVTALTAATLVLALRAGEVERLRGAVAIVSAAAVLAVAILAAAGDAEETVARLVDAALVAIAPPVVLVGVVRMLRERGTVTIQAVFGVLCVYLLLGMAYAFVYGAIDRLGGHPVFANGAAATASACQYFSFTTLTTVGYGDLTTRTNLGHTIAVSEALLGQVYLVTVVALLVSNLGRSRDRLG